MAKGSPLTPANANNFMIFYESKWLNEYNLRKRNFNLTYLDHILATFANKHDY